MKENGTTKLKLLEGMFPMGAVIDRGLSFIIYADAGTGKTSLASGLPVGETLIINTEAGYGPLLGTGHIVFNLDQDLKQLETLYQWVRVHDHPFKNVVIDNISEMQDWMTRSLTDGRGKDFASISEYGDASSKMKEYLTLFRDLTTERGMNVIFNAWEYPIEMEKRADGSVITKMYPKLFPKLAPEACGKMDVVGHLEIFEKTQERFLRFKANSRFIAKCQFKGLEELEEANLPMIINKIRAWNYMVAE
jgi:phage nucleotide-binding protein